MLNRAIFAGGCFWGIEASFKKIAGVQDTSSGYCGGDVTEPTYEQVCAGNTGHAEVVQITFDPKVITFEQLLEHFWSIHDPTTINRQGVDIGPQYRSAVFYLNEDQKVCAETSKTKRQTQLSEDIVTEISPAKTVWPAEEYHQCYLEKNGGSCSTV